jgi:hypothetical protein
LDSWVRASIYYNLIIKALLRGMRSGGNVVGTAADPGYGQLETQISQLIEEHSTN